MNGNFRVFTSRCLPVVVAFWLMTSQARSATITSRCLLKVRGDANDAGFQVFIRRRFSFRFPTTSRLGSGDRHKLEDALVDSLPFDVRAAAGTDRLPRLFIIYDLVPCRTRTCALVGFHWASGDRCEFSSNVPEPYFYDLLEIHRVGKAITLKSLWTLAGSIRLQPMLAVPLVVDPFGLGRSCLFLFAEINSLAYPGMAYHGEPAPRGMTFALGGVFPVDLQGRRLVVCDDKSEAGSAEKWDPTSLLMFRTTAGAPVLVSRDMGARGDHLLVSAWDPQRKEFVCLFRDSTLPPPGIVAITAEGRDRPNVVGEYVAKLIGQPLLAQQLVLSDYRLTATLELAPCRLNVQMDDYIRFHSEYGQKEVRP
jgi:hypothetical protein